MSYLSKLNFKTVTRIVDRDPVHERRTKFVGAVEEQRLVVAAALKGETYSKLLKPKGDAPAGSRQVRPWFFQKDGGWYLQARYGARVLFIDGKSNAIFAAKLADVDAALAMLIDAAGAGELDAVLELASRRGNRSAV
jgi:hypothetical protein